MNNDSQNHESNIRNAEKVQRDHTQARSELAQNLYIHRNISPQESFELAELFLREAINWEYKK